MNMRSARSIVISTVAAKEIARNFPKSSQYVLVLGGFRAGTAMSARPDGSVFDSVVHIFVVPTGHQKPAMLPKSFHTVADRYNSSVPAGTCRVALLKVTVSNTFLETTRGVVQFTVMSVKPVQRLKA